MNHATAVDPFIASAEVKGRTKPGHDLGPHLMVPSRKAGTWAGAAGALRPEPSTRVESLAAALCREEAPRSSQQWYVDLGGWAACKENFPGANGSFES